MGADPQADRVYRAERSIDQGAQLHAADQVRRYIATITTSEWWREHDWPAVKVHVGRGANAWGGRLASGAWYVNLPGFRSAEVEDDAIRAQLARRPVEWPWAWSELVICHELSHVSHLADVEGRSRPAAHGAGFCGRYIETTTAVLGPLAAWRLQRSFDRLHVAYANPESIDCDPLGWDAREAACWAPYVPRRAPREPTVVNQGVLV